MAASVVKEAECATVQGELITASRQGNVTASFIYRILEHVVKETEVPLRRSTTPGLKLHLPRILTRRTGQWLDSELMVKLVDLQTATFQAHVHFIYTLPWLSARERVWYLR